MKTKLNIIERFKIIELMQDRTGSFSTLQIIDALLASLALNETEMKDCGYQEFEIPGGGVRYCIDRSKDFEREFYITEIPLKKIQAKLKALDDREALRPDQIPIYKKFIVDVKAFSGAEAA